MPGLMHCSDAVGQGKASPILYYSCMEFCIYETVGLKAVACPGGMLTLSW